MPHAALLLSPAAVFPHLCLINGIAINPTAPYHETKALGQTDSMGSLVVYFSELCPADL